MKKIFFLLLAWTMVLCNVNLIFAEQKMQVFCEDIPAGEEEALRIPVYIQDNTGIMGFKIHIEYPKEKISVLGVERGTVTKEGSLSDNAGKEEGKLDVLWTGVTDATGDGTLFYMIIQPLGDVQKDITIQMTYSQTDTFNEAWEDVVLDCKDITLIATQTDIEEKEDTTETYASEYGIENIEGYVEEKTISEFIEDASCSMDNAEIANMIDEELKQNSITDFNATKEKAVETAVEKVLTALENEGIEAAKLIRTYKPEQKVKAVESLYEMVSKEDTKISTQKKKLSKKTEIEAEKGIEQTGDVVYIWMALLLGVGLVVMIAKKCRKRRESE